MIRLPRALFCLSWLTNSWASIGPTDSSVKPVLEPLLLHLHFYVRVNEDQFTRHDQAVNNLIPSPP